MEGLYSPVVRVALNAHDVAARRQSVNPIDAAIIGLEPIFSQARGAPELRNTRVDQDQAYIPPNHRIAAGRGDATGDYAAWDKLQLDPFKTLAIHQREGPPGPCPPTPTSL